MKRIPQSKSKVTKMQVLFLLLVFVVAFPMMNEYGGVYAANSLTTAQVKTWLDNEIRNAKTHGSGECVDFCNDYLANLWGTPRIIANARAWRCPSGWSAVNLNGNANNLRMGDLIVEDYSPYGHVAIYYGKENGYHYVVDQNSNYGTIRYPAKHIWWNPLSSTTYAYRPPFASVTPTVSFKAWSNSSYTYIKATDASIGQEVTASSGTISKAGMVLYDYNQNQLAKAENSSHTVARIYFQINKELKYTLTPMTTYKYRFYAIVGGKTYWSNYGEFVTLGTEMKKGVDSPVVPDGDYVIVNSRHTDSRNNKIYFLDIEGVDSVAPHGKNVQLCDYSSNSPDDVPPCDVWTMKYSNGYYTITQKGTNIALDNQNAKYNRGNNIVVATSNNGDSQKWAIDWVNDGTNQYGFRIQSKRNSGFVDVYGAGTTSGTNVQIWEKNNSAAQTWEFIPYMPEQPIQDGRYVLVSALDPTLTLDVSGDTPNVADATNVQVWHDNAPSKYNSFDVKKLSNGYYSFTHAASGKSLDISGGFSNAATWRYRNVHIYEKHEGLNQQFAITRMNNGYMLRARCSGLPLDVQDGKTANGTNVRTTQYWGQDNKAQSWYFVPAEYAVTYNANGGNNAPASQIKYYKENLSLSNQIPSRPGYVFKGWTTNVSRQTVEYSAGGIYKQDANLMLYAVWEKNSAETVAEPGDINTTETIEEELIQANDEGDPINSEFSKLLLRSSKQTKNSISLKWKKVAGASRYIIYGNECGVQNKMVKLDTVAGTSKKFTKIAGKNIKKGTYYKFVVVAADNNKVISISKMIHVATKGGKLGNHKSIKTAAKKNKLSLKNGKRFKLKAKAIAASKKNKISKHIGVRYESTNPRVAEVNPKGVITAKGKGKCTVYVYAQNGVYKAIKIRVK